MFRRTWRLLAVATVLAHLACAHGGSGTVATPQQAVRQRPSISAADEELLEDLSKRSFLFFWEQADPATGLVRDRARIDGAPVDGPSREVASIAAVGFGLTGMCIAAERGWFERAALVNRTRTTLRFFAERMPHERGWFFHFVNIHTGAREWSSELSSIDTALLLAGVLTVRQCFRGEAEIPALADAIYRRVDFQWMLAGHPRLLSHGWKPETGFLASRWDHYCELMILYLLAIGSPTHAIPPDSWTAWRRPMVTFQTFTYIGGPPPLFVHQYAHAWVDFRGRREREAPHTDWWQNSSIATRAHKAFVLSLAAEFPGYTENVWGVTASDSRKGYVAWGGPPRDPAIDGTVVPCAVTGSLMLTPDITLPAVREIKARFGDRIYGRYGFADAFHPSEGWVNPDVIGIDLGITVLSAENLRAGRIWEWFMRNTEVITALDRVGLTRPALPAR